MHARDRRLTARRCLLLGFATALPAAALYEAPKLNFVNDVNPVPRPYQDRVDVTIHTSLYFEVVVPLGNPGSARVDPQTLSATLETAGRDPVPLLLPGQVFAPGVGGLILDDIKNTANRGVAAYIESNYDLEPGRNYRVEVYAEALDGTPINPDQDSWSFTTRPLFDRTRYSCEIDLNAPTVHWNGWFFSGLLKPNFNTSRLFDQLDSYALMDSVRTINPDAWSLQRDWPLTSDYWHNGLFDGNPNLVREQETRQIRRVLDVGQYTLLRLGDLEEGPLYGIAPDRPLTADYLPGDLVTLGDREKFESARVIQVAEGAKIVVLERLDTAAQDWILDYPGSHPPDLPETPDNFTLPLCYLRKLEPPGTPVYYWDRVDDEWDIVHGQHGRRLQVNFSYTPLDLALEPVPGSTGGHGSISPPKDWLQWHDFVRELVFHLLDRYGEAVQDFYFSVGNENNFGIFWSGGKNGFYEYYDYTVNAVLTAFEDWGLPTDNVQVGGIEAAWLGGLGWTKDALYHCSGASRRPGGGIVETNYVCADDRFAEQRAARVEAICAAHAGEGSPIDFVSIHEYRLAKDAVADLNRVRADALDVDSDYYHDLNVTCFECTPDWIPRHDPVSGRMYEGNGYFPTWCADWMQRLVAKAETDPRYARHESVLTVWPFDYNGQGLSSITGLIRVDEDGDGREDRVATIKKGIFNYIELLAHLNRELAALPVVDAEGVRISGVRSVGDTHNILLYSHDLYDTESAEEQEFTIRMQLRGIPWNSCRIRRWRVDRDHSSPYHAYQALPEQSVYSPAQVRPLAESDDLVLDGPPQIIDTPGGSATIDASLRVNGVTLVEIAEND